MERGPGRPPKFDKMARAHFRIEQADLDAFDAQAEREGVTRTDAICEAIRDWTRRKARRK